MANNAKPTAKAEAPTTSTPTKRSKTPPPTLTECAEAVTARRQGLIQLSALIVQLDNLVAGREVPRDLEKAMKENAKARRATKASIRRAIKVIARFERAKAKSDTLVLR